MQTFKSRDEIKIEETWNLKDIYDDQSNWEKDYQEVLKMTEKLKTYDGHIQSAQDLFDYLRLSEELGYIYNKLYVFAMLQADLDTRVTSSQALLDRAGKLGQKISNASAFFMPFLLSLEENTLKGYIKEIEGLKYFEEDLLDSFRYKAHVLSKEQEEVLSQIGEAFSAPQKRSG